MTPRGSLFNRNVMLAICTEPSDLSRTETGEIAALFQRLKRHQAHAEEAIHLTASENVLSPLARLPFGMDLHARYFLDDLRLFGTWCFPAGAEPGAIEQEILTPVLAELAGASHVNVRPISGINCMTIALAALTSPGQTLLSVPVASG